MLRSTISLAVCTALAAPAAAGATDRFVAKTGTDAGPNTCSVQASPCLTIQRAINASTDDDVVHVGPGQFDESLSAASKRLVIRGAGAGPAGAPDPAAHTIVRAPNGFGLRMFQGGGLEDLRLEGGVSGSAGPALIASATSAGPALRYELSGVVLVAGALNTVQAPALRSDDGATGRSVNVTVTDSTLLARQSTDNDPDAIAEIAGESVVAGVARSRIRGHDSDDDTGLTVAGGALATLTDTKVGDDGTLRTGAGVDGDGMLSVVRSRVVAGTALYTYGDAAGEQASLLVLDSVVGPLPSLPGSALTMLNTAGSTTQASVRQSTLLSSANPEGAIFGFATGGGAIDGTFANTIVRGLPENDDPEVTAFGTNNGEASFVFEHSLFNRAKVGGSATTTTPGTGTNVLGDPRFLDVQTADLRPHPDSPAVDAGDPALVLPGEVDFAGAARNVDGDGDCKAAPDMGALELQGQGRPCPSPAPGPLAAGPAAATPATPAAATTTGRTATPVAKPRITGLRLAATRRGTSATFTLSQAAPVTLTIQRELPGLRRGKRCAKPSKALRARRAKRCVRLQAVATQRSVARAGTNTISSRKRLKRGRYRATLTADGGASPAVTRVTAR